MKNRVLAFFGLGPDGRSRAVNPASIAAPAANYAHARYVAGGPATKWLHTSGVVPIAPGGSVPEGIVAQAEVIWQNIGAMLTEAKMQPTNVVSVTTYVTPGHDLGPIMAVRDRALSAYQEVMRMQL